MHGRGARRALTYCVLGGLAALTTVEPATAARRAPSCGGKRATIVVHAAHGHGTRGPDVIVVARRTGARVRGGGGNDVICGGAGDDRLRGGPGKDVLRGRRGDDRLHGGTGRDRLTGGPGTDAFVTGRGDARTDIRAGEKLNGRRKTLISRLRRGTRRTSSARIARVSATPTGLQRIVFKRRAAAPKRGQVIVAAPGRTAPFGVLGRVKQRKRLSGGSVAVTVAPATLDQAYARFDLSVRGTLERLGARTATASAVAQATSLRFAPKFSCSGKLTRELNASMDLSDLWIDAEISTNVFNPSISFRLLGKPKLSVEFSTGGSASCRVTNAPTISMPLANTPLVLTFKPVFQLSASGSMSVSYTATPFLNYGFVRSRSGDFDERTFKPAAEEPKLSGRGTLSVKLALEAALSLAGSVGVGGQIGPQLDGRIESSPTGGSSRTCATAELATRVALTADADVFVRHWSFSLWKGSFGRRQILDWCSPPAGDGAPPTATPTPDPGTTDPPVGRVLPGLHLSHLAGGTDAVCGLRSGDGSAVCEGAAANNVTTTPTGAFTAITVGDEHACGLRPDGAAVCWGADYAGQSSAAPGAFTSISAGASQSCGVRPDGTLDCWGFSSTAPPAGQFSAVAAGQGHVCGLRANSTVECWGADMSLVGPPPAGEFARIYSDAGYSCGLRSDGGAECWGDSRGRFAVEHPPAGEYAQLALSPEYACGLRTNGKVVCWGNDDRGQASPPDGEFTAIATGSSYTCGLLTSGTAECWGAPTV